MRRERASAQHSLTSRMVLKRILEYPKILAEGVVLPPFIHPPCFQTQEPCCPHQPHSCLPDTLARCAKLCQRIISATSEEVDGIWNEVSKEAKRLKTMFHRMADDTRIQAMQAMIMYTLLQARLDDRSRGKEEMAALSATTESFSRANYAQHSMFPDIKPAKEDHKAWVRAESLRRTACLLYIVDLVLNISGQTATAGQCPEVICVALPCSRDLWTASTPDSWAKIYHHRKLGQTPQQTGLVLGNLLSLRHSDAGVEGDEALEEALCTWAEEGDEFCRLLWMATSLEGEEQTFLKNLLDPLVPL
ncbi:hypothetical protein LIA77_10096 [Sarocladium implicatum]|nr:hypothetical protein LIA77_10096 [Sarocladium implicatum]